MIKIRSYDEVTVNFSGRLIMLFLLVKLALFTLTSKSSH